MARIYLPPLELIPEGATTAERQKMFDEYKAKMIKMNPGRFNDDGTLKTAWELFMGLLT